MANFPDEFFRHLREHTRVGIRVGPERESFVEIWMVEVSGRVFARSWNRSESGWYGELIRGVPGELQFGQVTLPIAGKQLPTTSPVMSAIDEAYLHRFTQPENVFYAQGISGPAYHSYTVEILPAQTGAERNASDSVRAMLLHVPIVVLLSILGFFALIDAGRLEGFRSETTFAWMLVVGYPIVALLGLTQVALWMRWISKRGTPTWMQSRRTRRILFRGVLVLTVLASALLALRVIARWGLRE